MVFFFSRMSLCLKVKAHHNEYILYSWGHSLRYSSYYGGPQLSRKNQKPHGKTKNLTAKAKTSRQKRKPHGKIKIPHDKTKNLTAKPKTSRQNQILHSKNQIPHGNSKYPRQNQSHFAHCEVFGFAVGFLVLFALRYFVFAVRFLFLPWHGCGPPYSSHMTQKKNVLTGIISNKNLFLCSQNALFHALLVLLSLKKAILIMNKKSAASFNIS